MLRNILFVLSGLISFSAVAQSPSLLKDIDAFTESSTPDDIILVQGVAYFIADDGEHGRELWRSDGTELGTTMIKDINPGIGDSFKEDPYYSIQKLYVYQNELYFEAFDGSTGYELWKSDGTGPGTTLVKDITTGVPSSYIKDFAVYDNLLYFTLENGTLWKTDGTESNTVPAVGTTGYSEISKLTVWKDTLFFKASSPSYQYHLYKYDGASVDDVQLATPSQLTPVGDQLFFVNNDNLTGAEVWVTDGTTSGTSMVKDIYPGIGKVPRLLTAVGNEVFFVHYNSDYNDELWKSDGTEAGTVMVKEINPSETEGSTIQYLTAIGSEVYFVASDDGAGANVWKTDGTAEGTTVLSSEFYDNPQRLANVHDTLYFVAKSESAEGAIWRVDHSQSEVVRIKDIYQEGGNGKFLSIKPFQVGALFVADNGVQGVELWKSGGLDESTFMVKDINATVISGGDPQYLTTADDWVYFAAGGGTWATLWKTDGTSANTQLVSEAMNLYINPNEENNIVTLGNTALFAAHGITGGIELWKSDGTEAGTTMVKDIHPSSGSLPHGFTKVGETIYFLASDESGVDLWKTDGTEAGTVKMNLTTDYFGPTSLTAFNGELYFVNNDNVHGSELWKSDGTEAGTVLVKDIAVGGSSDGSYPLFFTELNGELFFRAMNGMEAEIWKTDGTEAGTIQVTHIGGGLYGSANPQHLTTVGDMIYFSTMDQDSGVSLWKTDGTDAGTTMVKDINSGSYGTLKTFIAYKGAIIFIADDGVHSEELWKSDGTEAGTVMVKDIHTAGDSWISSLTVVKDILYFSADNGSEGGELWQSDGTEAGTVMVADIYPGINSSNVGHIVGFKEQLIFTATDHRGTELWQYKLTLPPATAADVSIQMKEDQVYTFNATNFAYEGDQEELTLIQIATSPSKGVLFLDTNQNFEAEEGELIVAGDTIFIENIALLKFSSAANEIGSPYTSFNFKVANSSGLSSEAYQMTIAVSPVAEKPTVTATNTIYHQFNHDGLVLSPETSDTEVTHYRISNIVHGLLYLQDETTAVTEGSYITKAAGAAGLKFKATDVGTGSFDVQAAYSVTGQGLGEATTAQITIGRDSQVISFEQTDTLFVGESYALHATSSSGLDVSFSVSGSAVLEGNIITPTDTVAEVLVTASQSGNNYYEPANEVTIKLIIVSSEVNNEELNSEEENQEEENETGAEGENPEGPNAEEETNEEEVVTSILPEEGNEVTKVFPNPTDGQFNIILDLQQWRGGTITVTDILGKPIMKYSVVAEQLTLDISHYHSGSYFVIICLNDKSKVLRVLKK